MTDKRYSNHGSVFSLKNHFVWCLKYRMNVLVGDVEKRLRELLFEKATENGLAVDALEIMPDHVHIFIASDPTEASRRIANQLKGSTSRIFRKEFPHLGSIIPTLWSRSYCVGSVGHVSEETVKTALKVKRQDIDDSYLQISPSPK
jgi:putative transposase